MRVINSRASLLSDYEVLSLLRDIEAQQRDLATQPAPAVYGTPASSLLPNGLLNPLISRSTLSTSAGPTPAQTIAEAEDPDAHLALIPANLRTIQYEALAYLSNTTRACAHMHEHHIPEFLAALKEWEKEEGLAEVRLTKGERLMCVNHVPQTLVELSALIEELELRFTQDQMNGLLSLIQEHLPAPHAHSADETTEVEAHPDPNGFGNDEWQEDQNMEELENQAREAAEAEGDEFVTEGRGEGAVDAEEPEEE